MRLDETSAICRSLINNLKPRNAYKSYDRLTKKMYLRVNNGIALNSNVRTIPPYLQL